MIFSSKYLLSEIFVSLRLFAVWVEFKRFHSLAMARRASMSEFDIPSKRFAAVQCIVPFREVLVLEFLPASGLVIFLAFVETRRVLEPSATPTLFTSLPALSGFLCDFKSLLLLIIPF